MKLPAIVQDDSAFTVRASQGKWNKRRVFTSNDGLIQRCWMISDSFVTGVKLRSLLLFLYGKVQKS